MQQNNKIFIIISYHSQKRYIERVNIKGKSIRSIINNIFLYGLKASDCEGKLLDYIKSFESKSNTIVRIYKNVTYIFSGNILVTVIPCAKKYRILIKEAIANKRLKDSLSLDTKSDEDRI